MNPCSQSSSAAMPNCLLIPSGETDIAESVSTVLPPEMWCKIFNCLGFQNLKLFTEYKVKVLKKPLDGSEDNDRLMMGAKVIYYKEDFLDVVKRIYKVALCCREWYICTERERKLLVNCAQRARLDSQFFLIKSPLVVGPILMLSPPPPPSPLPILDLVSSDDFPIYQFCRDDFYRYDDKRSLHQIFHSIVLESPKLKLEPVKIELGE